MAIGQDALEGGMRLSQVRRTKKFLITAQIVIAVLAVIVLTAVGGNVQLKPFYFDVGVFLYLLILMVFIISVEGLLFRLLEVRFAKTESAKYFMLKTTARRGLWVTAAAAVCLLAVLTPFLLDAVSDQTSTSGVTAGADAFFNRDPLGLTTVDRITLDSDGPSEVLIVSEANYLAYSGDLERLRQASEVRVPDASPGVVVDFPHGPFGQYYVVVGSGEAVSYGLYSSLSPFFVWFVSLFAALFIVANLAWIMYTLPIRQRFAQGAIYR